MAIPQLIASEPLKCNTNKCELFVDGLSIVQLYGALALACVSPTDSFLC